MLTAERLRQVLDYDPTTGIFTWKETLARRAPAGSMAGYLGRNDHREFLMIGIDGRKYQTSWLAWFYIHGTWPKAQIDHRDGNPLNNCIDNLREATGSQNQANRGRNKNNTSGYKGVSRDKSGRWAACIWKDGQKIWLGCHDTAELAHIAYCWAARELNGEFARFE
jgi:hypothetical protein